MDKGVLATNASLVERTVDFRAGRTRCHSAEAREILGCKTRIRGCKNGTERYKDCGIRRNHGTGIAQSYLPGGYGFHTHSRKPSTKQKSCETNLRAFVQEGELTQAQADDINQISFHKVLRKQSREHSCSGNGGREPDIKTEIFKQLDELLPEDAVIVSNASSLILSVFERRLPNFTTAHWFAPPHILPLVEWQRRKDQ